GDGLQRLGGDRAAGEPQPVSLCVKADALDVDWVRSDVCGDALRLPAPQSTLDRLWTAARHDSPAGRCVWNRTGEWRATMDQVERILASAVGNRETIAGIVPGKIYREASG